MDCSITQEGVVQEELRIKTCVLQHLEGCLAVPVTSWNLLCLPDVQRRCVTLGTRIAACGVLCCDCWPLHQASAGSSLPATRQRAAGPGFNDRSNTHKSFTGTSLSGSPATSCFLAPYATKRCWLGMHRVSCANALWSSCAPWAGIRLRL